MLWTAKRKLMKQINWGIFTWHSAEENIRMVVVSRLADYKLLGGRVRAAADRLTQTQSQRKCLRERQEMQTDRRCECWSNSPVRFEAAHTDSTCSLVRRWGALQYFLPAVFNQNDITGDENWLYKLLTLETL